MTIFKPLPPAGARGLSPDLVEALESFIKQMDESVDMVIGVDGSEFLLWEEVLNRWKNEFPSARLQVICGPRPDCVPNPKIAWQTILAPHATGETWLWSDADIEVGEGFLDLIRAELLHSKCRFITCPYSARKILGSFGTLDALYVNVEFYPGVLLLRNRNVKFAFGAASLFYAEDFKQRVDWQKLGSTLADDNELGRQLAPIEISKNTIETLADEDGFWDAFIHYLRWHKTVRWCEPWGYAGQLALLPLLGWVFCVTSTPLSPVAWGGLVATGLFEFTISSLIFERLRCCVPIRQRWIMGLWIVVRPMAWLLSWTPAAVQWAGCDHRWLGLRKLELFKRS